MGAIVYIGTGGITPARRIIYRDNIPDALEDCQGTGHRPLSAREIADRRIAALRTDDYAWQSSLLSSSIKATGKLPPTNKSRQKGGTPVDIYGHPPLPDFPAYLVSSEEIREATGKGLTENGAGVLPPGRFGNLVRLAEGGEQGISLVDHELLMRWPSGTYGLDMPTKKHMDSHRGRVDGIQMLAGNHPQTQALLGIRNGDYLRAHRGHGSSGNQIEVLHLDDLLPDGTPTFRLLGFDKYYGRYSLDGDVSLSARGRFMGELVEDGKGALQDENAIARPRAGVLEFPNR